MPAILTTCPFCGCGCGLYLRSEEGRLAGVFPSLAHPVSQGRLCIKGWHAYELSMSPARLTNPLVRKEGELVAATWEEALQRAAEGLQQVKQQHGSQALAVLGSAGCTNEANFALMRLARQTLGTNNVDFSGRLDWAAASGPYPGSSIPSIDEADLILLVETDAGDEHPAITARLLRARRRGTKLIAVTQRRHRMARLAELHLQPSPGRAAEVVAGVIAATFTTSFFTTLPDAIVKSLASIFLRLADFSPEKAAAAAGVSIEQIRQAAQAFVEAKKPVALIGRGALRDPRAKDLISSVSSLFALGQAMGQQSPGADATGGWLALGAKANSRGAHEMGLDPALLTGYQPISEARAREAFEAAWGARLPHQRGLGLWEMQGAVRGMLIMADDSSFSTPDHKTVRKILEGLDFLVVQDSLAGELAERADVVLPGAAFGEEDGTFTSLDGRLQRVRRGVSPPGEARPHWEIVCQLAASMKTDFGFRSPSDVMDQIALLTPLYERISYPSLEEGYGRLLPIHFLHGGEFSVTPPLELKAEPPARESALPLCLAVDFSVSSWEGDPVVLSCPTLRREFSLQIKDFPAGFVEVNPDDAKRLGLRNGSKVRVVGREGEFTAALRISEEVPAGVVLLPFWQRERAFPVLEEKREAADRLPFIEPVAVRIEGA